MRNKYMGLPLRLVVLVATAFVAMLLLTNLLTPESARVTVAQGNEPEPSGADATLANCRYGASTSPNEVFVLPRLGAGVYYDWRADWPFTRPSNDAEFLHMIRPRQKKTPAGAYLQEWYPNVPLDENLADLISNDPGGMWMIGNEPERGPNPGETYSPRTDDIHADMYAEAYHEIYHFIKGVDPTARIANAGMIQTTPMRLQYLDMVWDAYMDKYGTPMPVDIWTIHAYVMPELTAGGQPNTIASAALGTDLSLGKRGSAGDPGACAADDVYCFAEHDDVSLLAEQVTAMRQWMKERGQQSKPLVITEYGTLYHYIVRPDGTCGGLRDENGDCFTADRVSKFMVDSFDYFNSAKNPALGLPSDNNKLVQQWIWYDAYGWDIGSSNLLEADLVTLTKMGKTFRDYVWAEPTFTNLVVADVNGSVIAYDENDVATARLTVKFRNNGNTAVDEPFAVTFYKDEGMSQPIGTTDMTLNVRGCATGIYQAKVDWAGLPKGTHQFWVKVDSAGAIAEKVETDNVGSGVVDVTGPVYTIDIEIVSNGEGVGGAVSATPEGLVYPEGTEVNLVAVPASGWTFEKWSGAIAGTLPQISVTMRDDVVLKAHFVQEHYQLDLNIDGEGEVAVDPKQNTYLFGDVVTLTAVPSEGWYFLGWRGDVEANTAELEHSFIGDVSVTAVFQRDHAGNAIYNPVVMTGS